MKLFRKKWFWILALILIIIVILFLRFGKKNGPTYVTAQAAMGDLKQTVEVTGSVKSAEEVQLNFTASGRVANIPVKTGDDVKAGQLLANLVATDVGSQVNDARAALDIARNDYDQLLAGASQPDIEVTKQELISAQVAYQKSHDDFSALEQTRDLNMKSLINSTINTANNKLSTAQYALDLIYDAVADSDATASLLVTDSTLLGATRNGYQAAKSNFQEALYIADQAKQIQNYDQTVAAGEKVETVLEQILVSINNSYNLMGLAISNNVYTTSVISGLKTSLSSQGTALTTAISAMQSDVAGLKNNNLSYSTQLTTAQNDIDSKQANLDLVKAKLELKTAQPRDFEIKTAEAQIRRAQATLDRFYGEYSKTIITAPFDGIITDINYKKGEQTSPSQAVLTLIGLSDKEIEVDVPESDIAKVKLGQTVDITLDAFSSDQKFQGQVMFIDPASTNINNVIYYKVKVNFVEKNDIIKAGMTANLTINTDERRGVLTVPARAVIYRENEKFVQLLQNGKLVEKPVQTGLRGDDGLVEILSGIQAGDTVITYINDSSKK